MTDPRIAALAEALREFRARPDWAGFWTPEQEAAAILGERGVFLPDGLPRPPEGTRLILAATDVLPKWGTRTDDGASSPITARSTPRSAASAPSRCSTSRARARRG